MGSLTRIIASQLGLSSSFVDTVVFSASRRYKRFSLEKRTGGKREILHPARELKALQYWIARKILPCLPVHSAATAYEVGSSIRKNAAAHRQGRYLLRIDFADFFPSLRSGDVAALLADRAALLPEWWEAPDTDALCRIVCRDDRLTIGSVTSPSLANRLCMHLDERVTEYAREGGLVYTRYADDLFFSSNAQGRLSAVSADLEEVLRSLSYPGGLRINGEKTRNLSRRQRWRVTGVVITCDDGLSVGRDLKRRLHAIVHQLPDATPEDRAWLRGMLAHVSSVEPGFIDRLYLKYGSKRVDQARR